LQKEAKSGPFLIVKAYEGGERIPWTLSDTNPERGTITIIYVVVGKVEKWTALDDPTWRILFWLTMHNQDLRLPLSLSFSEK
jgi:hypothetical protein